jgi:hypothetical protein
VVVIVVIVAAAVAAGAAAEATDHVRASFPPLINVRTVLRISSMTILPGWTGERLVQPGEGDT